MIRAVRGGLNQMKKFFGSLPARLVIGIVLGILFGQVFNESIMGIVVSVKNILGQVINFVVPLIVIGFIAPSITKLGNNASKMLVVALGLAYVSSVLAALLSMTAGFTIIPSMPFASEVESLRELPPDVFGLEIPQIMGVMSALAFSVLLERRKLPRCKCGQVPHLHFRRCEACEYSFQAGTPRYT